MALEWKQILSILPFFEKGLEPGFEVHVASTDLLVVPRGWGPRGSEVVHSWIVL
jgi:hypothetical protein